jgi:hypothetical protein
MTIAEKYADMMNRRSLQSQAQTAFDEVDKNSPQFKADIETLLTAWVLENIDLCKIVKQNPHIRIYPWQLARRLKWGES